VYGQEKFQGVAVYFFQPTARTSDSVLASFFAPFASLIACGMHADSA